MSSLLSRGILQQIKNNAPIPFLLDIYSGAAVAFSLRQLKTGVTNVIQVRRTGDNALSDFTAAQVIDGTLTSWVVAGGGDEGGYVTIWYDQSGNGNNLRQATTTLQPRIVLSGALINLSGTSRPTLDGWINDAFMVLDTRLVWSSATAFTLVNVAIHISLNVARWTWGDSNSQLIGMRSTTGIVMLNTVNNTLPDIYTTSYVLVGARGAGTNTAYLKVNTTDYGPFTDSINLELDRGFGRSDTLFLQTNQSEFILFESDYVSDMNAIKTEVNNFYGVY